MGYKVFVATIMLPMRVKTADLSKSPFNGTPPCWECEKVRKLTLAKTQGMEGLRSIGWAGLGVGV